RPGQQAAVDRNSKLIVNNVEDMDEVMAWKLGYFNFDNVPLQQIMQQISRWYDCEVAFETQMNQRFSFKMRRDVPVSKLLKILEKTGSVKFAIDGKKIRVLK